MYAVFRETTYPPDKPLHLQREFKEFQDAHARRPGYRGTIVTDVGNGRYLTVTLWESEADMNAAREALGPVVGRLLNPMMTTPAVLLGTGRVVVDDLTG
jgi:hypothetical protein